MNHNNNRKSLMNSYPFSDNINTVATILSESNNDISHNSNDDRTQQIIQRVQLKHKQQLQQFKQIQEELNTQTKHKPTPPIKRAPLSPHKSILALVDRLAADPFIRQMLPGGE